MKKENPVTLNIEVTEVRGILIEDRKQFKKEVAKIQSTLDTNESIRVSKVTLGIVTIIKTT